MFSENPRDWDLLQQLKTFDESNVGVKGIADAGITKTPPFFIQLPTNLSVTETELSIPVVDLANMVSRHVEVVNGVRQAVESVGLFQVRGEPWNT